MKCFFLSLTTLLVAAAPASANARNNLEGRWKNGRMEIMIAPCGRALCGTVVKASAGQQAKAEAPASVGTAEAPLEAAIDHIAEVAIPFERLGVKEGEPIQFFVELLQGGQSRDRAPREGTIALTCPPPNFEQIMWDV